MQELAKNPMGVTFRGLAEVDCGDDCGQSTGNVVQQKNRKGGHVRFIGLEGELSSKGGVLGAEESMGSIGSFGHSR